MAIPLLGGAALPALAARVRHHEVTATLDPATAHLRVVDRVDLELGAHRGADLSFLLHRELDLVAVRLQGRVLPVQTRERFRPRDFWERPPYDELEAFATARQHTLPAPAEGWGERVQLELEYAGTVADSLKDPEVAYGRGFKTTSGLIDRRGAFLFGATFWVPWFSDDLFGFQLTTSLPASWHSMSQGQRVQQTVQGGRNVTTWVEPRPMEEIYLIAGPYVIREDQHGPTRLYTYTYPNTDDALCRTYLEATGRYLDRYQEQFGAYPFAKFAMVENWWQTGYGMPSFTFLGDRVIRLPFIVNTSYGHEILHNWWGNGVYVAGGEGNWCEGLTTYGADYAYKEDESPALARDARRDALAGYRDHVLAGGRDFALRNFRERSDFATQAVGYGKTMMVFHMLRQRLGPDVFTRGLRHLYETHVGREAGWSDLAARFGEVAEQDLRPWFAQWVDRPGALALSARVERSPEPVLHVAHEGAPYVATIPVVVRDGDGSHLTSLALEGNEGRLVLPATTREVTVDPDFHLFRKLYREEVPAQLSQTLGAAATAIVLGEDTPQELADPLRTLAEEWARRPDVSVHAGEEPWPAGASVFFFGPGRRAREAVRVAAHNDPAADAVVQRAAAEGLSLVFCTRDPQDPEIGWTVVWPADAAAVAPVGRKLPHYGRSSYLLFRGDENVGKGTWDARRSPLSIQLEESP